MHGSRCHGSLRDKSRSPRLEQVPAVHGALRDRVMSVRTTAKRKIPRPPGATVELPHVSAEDAELVRHRAMLDAVSALEFPYRSGGVPPPYERVAGATLGAGTAPLPYAGRGIVICGGGERYLPSAYVLVRILRHLKCALPVEIWHLGEAEMPATMRGLFAELGAVCVDGSLVRRTHPVRRLGGWELKCFSIMHSAFEEVLLLDADNCPVRDPAFLFEEVPYLQTGAIFWPDYTRLEPERAVWAASGVEYRDEPEFESGQIVVDKRRCWKALNVAMHLNEYSDWWYRLVHGDKETFHLAWRKIGQDYAMPERGVEPLDCTMLQFDFAGQRLFQHRNFAKWKLDGNRHIVGFRLEKECMQFVAELRAQWVPGAPRGVRKWDAAKADAELQAVADDLCREPLRYQRIGIDERILVFLPDGTIGDGGAGCERWWNLRRAESGNRIAERTADVAASLCDLDNPQSAIELQVYGEQGLTFRAHLNGDGAWHGRWEVFEKAEVVLAKAESGNRIAESTLFRNPAGRPRYGTGCGYDGRR
jgi:hypothetical protein